MKFFDVRLRMPASEVGKVLNEYAQFFIGCDEVKEVQSRHQRNRTYANGKHDKGIKASTLVLQELADKIPHSRAQLQSAMMQRGFAESSIHPTLSQLVRSQEVRRLGADHFIINTSTAQGALDLPPAAH